MRKTKNLKSNKVTNVKSNKITSKSSRPSRKKKVMLVPHVKSKNKTMLNPTIKIKTALDILQRNAKLAVIEKTENSILVARLKNVLVSEHICSGAGFQPHDFERPTDFVVFYLIGLNALASQVGPIFRMLANVKSPELVYVQDKESLEQWMNSL